MVLRSSRALPGQLWAISLSSMDADTPDTLRPCFWFISLTMASTMAGRSSMMFAQRRHGDVEDVEPVEKVGAQMPLAPRLAGIAIGGRQHAHVHILLGARAQPPELPLFQHAQQLGLRAGRHFAHLVQQQRAARGQLEAAGPAARSRP